MIYELQRPGRRAVVPNQLFYFGSMNDQRHARERPRLPGRVAAPRSRRLWRDTQDTTDITSI